MFVCTTMCDCILHKSRSSQILRNASVRVHAYVCASVYLRTRANKYNACGRADSGARAYICMGYMYGPSQHARDTCRTASSPAMAKVCIYPQSKVSHISSVSCACARKCTRECQFVFAYTLRISIMHAGARIRVRKCLLVWGL